MTGVMSVIRMTLIILRVQVYDKVLGVNQDFSFAMEQLMCSCCLSMVVLPVINTG